MKKRVISFGQTKKSWLDKLIEWVRLGQIVTQIPEGANLLDLGCGYKAELLTQLSDRLKSGTGVDLSVDRKLNKSNLKLIPGKVDEHLPFEKASFEVVTALAIIEHVDYPKIMLSEIRRVLNPGGIVLITTPSLLGKWPLEIMAALGIISRAEIRDHKRYYTANSLKKALREAGFRKVKVRHFGIMYLNLLATARI